MPQRTRNYKDKVYKSHYVRLGINHVDPRPLDKMYLLFGGSLEKDIKASGPNRKPRCQWKLSCQEAKDFLLAVKPYLVNKDIVAEIALSFFDTISQNKKTLSDEVVSFRQECATRLKLVNSQS